ncbi:MAG: histone deacetylase, partial [Candidatus Promineifilaceae bacterium]|nr:histone deacetylase [Candidatus Promineifilaceae bacterium]
LLEPQLAAERQITRVHAQQLVDAVRQISERGGGLIDADTYTTPQSYELALLAAGSCCLAVDKIMSGEAKNGLALVRPPGHHAGRGRAGGFCLFNNIAVAARQAQAAHHVQRVLIVDIDVHHGNGTQDIFYDDGDVMFASLHLYHPFFYPGTGGINEIGSGNGRGKTLNVPFPPHVGDSGYRQTFEQILLPCARQFEPELVLVSIGFDAHWQDPLASAAVSLEGYATMVRLLLELAADVCDDRILFVLEGGYLLEALRYGVLNLVYALLGRDNFADPLGVMATQEEDISELLIRLRQLHLLN